MEEFEFMNQENWKKHKLLTNSWPKMILLFYYSLFSSVPASEEEKEDADADADLGIGIGNRAIDRGCRVLMVVFGAANAGPKTEVCVGW